MSLFTRLIISKINEEVNGVKTFSFEGEEARKISYQAGQYLTFVLPTNAGEIRRSYSLTSSPATGEPLSVAVKRIENGVFSRYLAEEAKVGDELLTTGAAGFFTFPGDFAGYKQLFFFAAGSGITPIYSLTKTALLTHPEKKVVLVYSNRTEESTLFLKELQALEKKFPDQLSIEFLYSTSPDLYRARLHKDLLKTLVKAHSVAPMERSLFYLCGPENYMVMCGYGLYQLGVPDSNIRKETFTTAKVLPKLSPPDKEPHEVRLKLLGEEYHFIVQFPETIHRAAKKKGIILPYSCEVGRCGNCVARCKQGEVWMSYNEVLSEHELEAGLVLTCVGYPIGGDVELEIS
ncbi:ferredoxin--NADP reductase [Nafulsella turpanensis]|uniref:ferredoxin--NADP reductase n=1 Tax=Nafulsella turpanensis TaxID=1265690 RepID=UPI00034CA9B6|nr:ferredoxin--NADP reductase [Nafulsella turpanensis]